MCAVLLFYRLFYIFVSLDFFLIVYSTVSSVYTRKRLIHGFQNFDLII